LKGEHTVEPARPPGWAATLLAVFLGILLLWALHGGGHFLHVRWLGSLAWLVPAFVAVALVRRKRHAGAGPGVGIDRQDLPGLVLFGCLVVYLFSSAATHPRFFFPGWGPEGGWESVLLRSRLARFVCVTALLTPVFLWRRTRPWLIVFLILVFCQFQCLNELISKTDALPLYGDDHPSFMNRLWVFGQTFPRLVYYNPFWNGGKVAAYIVASGTTSVGTALWPVWRFGNMTAVYTPALAFLFIVAVPFLVCASVRMVRGSVAAAFTGGLLGLTMSRYFFVWFLHFGTVGAAFSLSFIALLAAGLYRLLWSERRELWPAALVVVSAFMLFAWPPALFMSLPLLLGAVCSVRRWPKSRIVLLALTAAAAALVCLPYLFVILGRVDVQGFAEAGKAPMDLARELTKGWRRFGEHLRQGQPLTVFLGMAGVCVLPSRALRRFFVPTVLGLLFLASWGKIWLPKFELSRAGIPLFFVASLPAALWAGRILETRAAGLAPVRAAIAAFLLVAGLNTAKIYDNKHPAPYRVMPPEITDLVAWIRTHTPEDGRILFAGCTVHGYGGGHVAFLPAMTGREMMACDYYHFSPARVEYNYPPRAFRGSCARELTFFDLYNVTHVVSYHKGWLAEFRAHPELFEEVWTFGRRTKKSVFRVRRRSSPLLKGLGSVEAKINVFHVRVDDPHEPIVLRYHWDEGLAADPPVDIRPYDVGHQIRFIEVHPNGKKTFRIRFKPWL